LVGEPGAVGEGESGGFPALSLGTAGPPIEFVGPTLLGLPAVLPIVVPDDIPVLLPVVALPADDIPGFESPSPLLVPPACAKANGPESASAEASASVAIFMRVFLWSRQIQREAPTFVPAGRSCAPLAAFASRDEAVLTADETR